MPSKKNAVTVEAETVAFVRTVHAASLLLLQAGRDRSQQESALMMIIEACNHELDRLCINDSSHNRLPDSK